MTTLGNALFIVNPAAQNGNGARGAARVRYASREYPQLAETVAIVTTEEPLQASAIAEQAKGYDTVVALGGDGIIHETVAGLMRIPEAQRPALAVVPCGNGNDYARTLGMAFDFDASFRQLACAHTEPFDVGFCNGEPFVETLSFGLDAAIALGTHQRRLNTGRSGTALFVEEGINQLGFHRDIHPFTMVLDDGEPLSGSMHLLAVQIGPTYGGGFAVCPDANPRDGLFDICIAHAPIGMLKAAVIFMRAKNGGHLGYTRELSFARASSIRLSFDKELPVQIDGERFEGVDFDISLQKRALQVFVPAP